MIARGGRRGRVSDLVEDLSFDGVEEGGRNVVEHHRDDLRGRDLVRPEHLIRVTNVRLGRNAVQRGVSIVSCCTGAVRLQQRCEGEPGGGSSSTCPTTTVPQIRNLANKCKIRRSIMPATGLLVARGLATVWCRFFLTRWTPPQGEPRSFPHPATASRLCERIHGMEWRGTRKRATASAAPALSIAFSPSWRCCSLVTGSCGGVTLS